MIVGVAIGIASNTAPVYIAEMAPPTNRGALVALNIVTVAFGQLISYITCGLLSYVSNGWRCALCSSFAPCRV
jgi:MFS transporter, SP family, galactose:H+ symporter